MQIVIESGDFRRLSPETQREILNLVAGTSVLDGLRPTKRANARWREPVDLTPDLARRLLHGVSDNHRERLEIFARNGGRARMSELLKVTGDTHWRALSLFEGAMTRRLRRLIGDDEKKANLIGWDYDSTVWDKDHKEIVDGVYFVTPDTAEALKQVLLG